MRRMFTWPQGRTVGIAKGAGVIEPNLATMLVYILTDLDVPRAALREAFRTGLALVCHDLTEDVVRNGEGVHHVMRVKVSSAPSQALARSIGKSVVNSPLFQCAVAGNDPNVGRLVCAIGKHVGAPDLGVSLEKDPPHHGRHRADARRCVYAQPRQG